MRIRARRLRGRADHLDAGGGEDGIEPGGELRIPIAEQKPQRVGSLVEFHQQVTGLLDDPGTGRVRRDTDKSGPGGWPGPGRTGRRSV
jgi:hypothetical protein